MVRNLHIKIFERGFEMSLGKAIIGGLFFGTPGFIIGAMLNNEKKKVTRITVSQPTTKQTIKDEFYKKLNNSDFNLFVYTYCDENHLNLNDLDDYYMEELIFEYDDMIRKNGRI